MGEQSQKIPSVVLVVDRNFGSKLVELANKVHTWIVDTPVNLPAVQEMRAKGKPFSLQYGVTVFDDVALAPDELAESMLGSIDEHHPDWNRLEVWGCRCTPLLQMALTEMGCTSIQDVADGFIT